MMDSGIRTGPDIARALAKGADFTFLGRAFMYDVCALGKKAGNNLANLLKKEFLQVLEQTGCSNPYDLKNKLI